jgi:hypothetical protein
MRRLTFFPLLLAASSLVGCDLFGDSAEKVAAAKEAEGRAIGGACRHAGRAIEDCYALNKKADKASVFAGWRDMNDYMRENKIEAVAPQLGTKPKSSETKTAEAKPESAAEAAPADPAPADKKAGKPGKAAKAQES